MVGGRSDDPLGAQPGPEDPTRSVPSPTPRVDHDAFTLELPHRVGRYTLQRIIGAGGMGVVYEALQDQPRRTVAVKLMRSRLGSPEAEELFAQESQALALLRHPGIAQVFEAGTSEVDGVRLAWFAMEFIPGAQPLTQYASDAGLTLRERLKLLASVCDAVEHAHAHGVIHRDLKPANILVDADGHARIIDFGLARFVTEDRSQIAAGSPAGTPAYMPPEQRQGKHELVDARSDVYALGVTAKQLLGGQPNSEPLPGEVRDILARATDADRARRYGSAGALAADLRSFLDDRPVHAHSSRPGYRVMLFVRSTAARRPLLALLAVTAIAWAAATWVVAPVLFANWHPVNAWFGGAARCVFPAASGAELSTVRVIEMRDADDFDSLATEAGLSGVSSGKLASLRKLHGHLMERLAAAGPQVVAWDIMFRVPSEYDDAFLTGVRALRSVGIDTVVGAGSWALNAQGLPPISPALLPEVKWGVFTAMLPPNGPWWVDLALAPHEAGEPRVSFITRAYASCRRPGAEVTPFVDSARGALGLKYWLPSAVSPALRQWTAGEDSIAISSVLVQPVDEHLTGLRRGDVHALCEITIPHDAVLAPATWSYSQAMRASPQDLRKWIGGRAIVIGDARGGGDIHITPDGRPVAGCLAQAQTLDILLRTAIETRPRPLAAAAIVAAGALAGVCAVQWLGWRLRRRLVAYVIVGFILTVAALTYFGFSRMLIHPLMPLSSMVVAGELWARVARVRANRGFESLISPAASSTGAME